LDDTDPVAAFPLKPTDGGVEVPADEQVATGADEAGVGQQTEIQQ
jgi:hypothetical protein